MPIAILEEHNDLADSVRSYVARVAPSEVLHEALESPIPNPPPYWKSAAEQGLQGVHLAESVGGQGFGILELAIVAAEYVLGWLPRGTHNWDRFVTPGELSRHLGAAGFAAPATRGIVYDLMHDEWRLGRDCDVNYLAAAALPG